MADFCSAVDNSTFRCVKDRYTGRANGNTMCLHFERDTGQLVECEFPEDKGGGANRWSHDADDDDDDDGGLAL